MNDRTPETKKSPVEDAGSDGDAQTDCRAPGCDDPAAEQYHDGFGNSLDVCESHFEKFFWIEQLGPHLDRTVTHETSEEAESGLFGGLFQ